MVELVGAWIKSELCHGPMSVGYCFGIIVPLIPEREGGPEG